jgi:hypothetical protein
MCLNLPVQQFVERLIFSNLFNSSKGKKTEKNLTQKPATGLVVYNNSGCQ